MVDYSVLLADYAAYMPAVTPGYATFPLWPAEKDLGRLLPAGLTLADFNFLRADSSLFYYDKGLMSAGRALGDSSDKFPDPMITDRENRSPSTTVMWDSGGYQLIGGKIKWRGDNSRSFILRACEYFADVAMTIDFPPHGSEKRKKYQTYEECRDITVKNLQYYVKHRKSGPKPLFLNVLQGEDQEHTDDWYNHVKVYPFEGWAFGGPLYKTIAELLRRLVIMCDENMLDNTKWLHILGTNRLPLICAYTTIKTVLSRELGKPIQVSCDSSSPFTMAYASHMGYLGHVVDKNAMLMDQHRFPNDDYSTETDKMPFPTCFPSAISGRVNLSDICLSDKSIFAASSWDTMSYNMIANHNLETLLNAIVCCHRMYLSDQDDIISQCPDWLISSRHGIEEVITLVRCREGIEEALTSITPMDAIKKYAADFDWLHRTNRRLREGDTPDDYEERAE